jgi:hypothetical protein
VLRLAEVFRQAAQSRIIITAHRIVPVEEPSTASKADIP